MSAKAKPLSIAVLALQGAFIEHRHALSSLGVNSFEIRQLCDIDVPFDGLILPGGESSVMGKLLLDLGLFAPIRDKILNGLPVFGTCAGLLLLAKHIANQRATHLATMDISAVRNAYGRQLGSFHAEAEFLGIGKTTMSFIRAPYIESVSGDTQVLATVDGKIVAARQGMQLVTAFHPELQSDCRVHSYFIDMVLRQHCS